MREIASVSPRNDKFGFVIPSGARNLVFSIVSSFDIRISDLICLGISNEDQS